MRFAPRVWLLLVSLLASGCFQPRMLRLHNLDARVPEPAPSEPWKARLAAIARSYESALVVSAGDDRFEPIGGGITTLAYYASDLQQKLLDQRVDCGVTETGVDLETACRQSPEAGAQRPRFQSLWLPVSIDGKPLPESARCSSLGAPEPANDSQLCLFGRLALHGPGPRPLYIVMHGMFDSSAQQYVRNLGERLFAQGHSVLLLDARDHGQTLRAAPAVPTSLGLFEADDVRTVAARVRMTCAAHVASVGAVGVSGGGLNAILAYAGDGANGATPVLDAGVVALSPLVDIPMTTERMDDQPTCLLTDAVELTWTEHLGVALAGALTFGGGALVYAGATEQKVDEKVLIASGVGAAAGLLASTLFDALGDGDSATSDDCVGSGASAGMFADMLHARFAALQSQPGALMTEKGRKLDSQTATLADYLSERAVPYYAARKVKEIVRWSPEDLARALLQRSDRGGGAQQPRLLVLGAHDDPVVHIDGIETLHEALAQAPAIEVLRLRHGGHGAFWIVQQALTERLLHDFLSPAD